MVHTLPQWIRKHFNICVGPQQRHACTEYKLVPACREYKLVLACTRARLPLVIVAQLVHLNYYKLMQHSDCTIAMWCCWKRTREHTEALPICCELLLPWEWTALKFPSQLCWKTDVHEAKLPIFTSQKCHGISFLTFWCGTRPSMPYQQEQLS